MNKEPRIVKHVKELSERITSLTAADTVKIIVEPVGNPKDRGILFDDFRVFTPNKYRPECSCSYGGQSLTCRPNEDTKFDDIHDHAMQKIPSMYDCGVRDYADLWTRHFSAKMKQTR